MDALKDWVEVETARLGACGVSGFRGAEWWQLCEAEQTVFAIPLEDMPRLVAVWKACQALAGICFEDELGGDLVREGRAACPWIRQQEIDQADFLRFCALFGVPNRRAAAFYHKTAFHDVRAGLVHYADERKDYSGLSANYAVED